MDKIDQMCLEKDIGYCIIEVAGQSKNLAKNWAIRKLGNKNRVDIVSLSVVAGQPSACAPLITQTTAGLEQKQQGIRIQQQTFFHNNQIASWF